jgi:hypothetical protein
MKKDNAQRKSREWFDNPQGCSPHGKDPTTITILGDTKGEAPINEY